MATVPTDGARITPSSRDPVSSGSPSSRSVENSRASRAFMLMDWVPSRSTMLEEPTADRASPCSFMPARVDSMPT